MSCFSSEDREGSPSDVSDDWLPQKTELRNEPIEGVDSELVVCDKARMRCGTAALDPPNRPQHKLNFDKTNIPQKKDKEK